MMNVELRRYQMDAIKKLDNGKILCGDVGSGKSRTAIAYYFLRECKGSLMVNGKGDVKMMKQPKDLYIITTAMKRDKHEWEAECAPFGICANRGISFGRVKVTVDSWNNIKKYEDVDDSFFIFDEQRLSGYGAWSKTFRKIAEKNRWIMLSATPGDVWMDYITVFVANGFFKNKTDFVRKHVIYRQNVTFPVVDHYMDEWILEKLRDRILVKMDYIHEIKQNHIDIKCEWDSKLYNRIMKERADPDTGEPYDNISALLYKVRSVANADQTRQQQLKIILERHGAVIVFYNFDYELEILRKVGEELSLPIAEWNGHHHQPIPESEKWLYLVQYNSGAEGWNCTRTNVIVFYSLNYSYKIMAQSAGRINRLNTPFDELYYYYLKSNAPIDRAIARALANKKTFNESAFMGLRA